MRIYNIIFIIYLKSTINFAEDFYYNNRRREKVRDREIIIKEKYSLRIRIIYAISNSIIKI